ncbi:MAG: ferritin-like domain-containing protein [Gammaproteobacteria bacterium AqS3]|nr:ferritin-like domain-containing protein [Gammaproteobacteria bacterium AqS3]
MKIQYVDQDPRSVREFPVENEHNLSPQDVTDIAEIFQTPLSGAYNWDYTLQDNRIKKLYELGKELNWNAEKDIDWSRPMPPPIENCEDLPGHWLWVDYPEYQKFSDAEKHQFARHRMVWSLSQFLHGEQGALLVASQLVSCAPTYNAKLYAASQTFDEARHVEVFNKYIQDRYGLMYPIGQALKSIVDKILTDERWDLKFIGMQIIIEGLALAAFASMRESARDSVLADVLGLVLRDEARHVTFGVNYLEDYVQDALTQDEREDRAEFAYEACQLARERMLSVDVFAHFGWDVEAARRFQLEKGMMQHFQSLLFGRVMPNLKRIGLLTDRIAPKFEQLGILEYADMPDDGVIDWADLSRPLYNAEGELA